MYVCLHPVLSFFAAGKPTGVVVDCGESATHVVPIENGEPITDAITHMSFAGGALTETFQKLLLDNKLKVDYLMARHMKEKLCLVAEDYTNLPSKSESYKLPDGKRVFIGPERFTCPEALFQPSLIDDESTGIHKATYNRYLHLMWAEMFLVHYIIMN